MYANLKLLAPKATNAHLKIFGAENGTLVGYDIDRLVRILAEAGYDGPLQFELVQPDADTDLLVQARDIVRTSLERLKIAGGIR